MTGLDKWPIWLQSSYILHDVHNINCKETVMKDEYCDQQQTLKNYNSNAKRYSYKAKR